MYNTARYRSDLRKAWKPVKKAARTFGKSPWIRDPFASFEPCLALSLRFILFIWQLAFYSARRLINR